MGNYLAWVKRAEEFAKQLPLRATSFSNIEVSVSVEPPLDESGLEALQRAIPQPLPDALSQFWLTGSRCCNCRYVCREAEGNAELYGGASFFDALELHDYLTGCREWAEKTWVAEYAEERHLWLHSVPFLAMQNGDYLGLHVGIDHAEPPVVYLAHDDESFTIASTFTDFLEVWERVGYIGPEVWMLDGLLDEHKFLDANTEQAHELRKRLAQT
jgi:hypothetical protein